MGECDYKSILSKDKGFNQEEYEQLVANENGIPFVDYRWTLIKRRNNTNINFEETKENVESLFLESFSDNEYARLIKNLKSNGWSIKEAYNKVAETGRTISYISRIKNV